MKYSKIKSNLRIIIASSLNFSPFKPTSPDIFLLHGAILGCNRLCLKPMRVLSIFLYAEGRLRYWEKSTSDEEKKTLKALFHLVMEKGKELRKLNSFWRTT